MIRAHDLFLRLTLYLHFDDNVVALDPEFTKIRCIGFRSKILEFVQVRNAVVTEIERIEFWKPVCYYLSVLLFKRPSVLDAQKKLIRRRTLISKLSIPNLSIRFDSDRAHIDSVDSEYLSFARFDCSRDQV